MSVISQAALRRMRPLLQWLPLLAVAAAALAVRARAAAGPTPEGQSFEAGAGGARQAEHSASTALGLEYLPPFSPEIAGSAPARGNSGRHGPASE